jgi:hypothetical protein
MTALRGQNEVGNLFVAVVAKLDAELISSVVV